MFYWLYLFILCLEHLKQKNKDKESYSCYSFFVMKLQDIQKATVENAPILCVGIAENDGSSSTLFIVDEHGIRQVTLASGKQGIYRKGDGLILEKNVIRLSLGIDHEIHDFKITVIDQSTNETPNIIYQNVETIRKK